MNIMSHKGYNARIEFDDRDNIFVGRILGVRTMISFHGETVAELRSEFEHAVDDYVHECKEQGTKPESQPRASSCCGCRPTSTAGPWFSPGCWKEPQ